MARTRTAYSQRRQRWPPGGGSLSDSDRPKLAARNEHHWPSTWHNGKGGRIGSLENAVYVAILRRRIQIAAAAKIADGTKIQTSSLARTRAPHSLKNARTLIGET